MVKIGINATADLLSSFRILRLGLKLTGYIVVLLTPSIFLSCAELKPWNDMKETSSSASSMFVAPQQDNITAKHSYGIKPEFPPEIEGKALTLADCIKISLERNPRTRISWQIARAAAAGVGGEKSAYLPAAELGLAAGRADSVSLSNNQALGPQNTYEAGFSVGYLLFDGGARSARVSSAEAELQAANFRHNTMLQDIALSVEEAYYQLLADQWVLKVAQETVKQTQYHVDLARARHQSGLVARSDVLKAETERADAELFMVQANSGVRIARGQLAGAIGLKVSQSFEVAELPEGLRAQELANVDLLLEEAARERPELHTSLALIESKRAEIKAAQAEYWPTIGADAGYGWRDRTFVPSQDEWSVGIGLNLSIFTGFNRTYRIQSAKADLARASAEYENLLQEVELEVWTAYAQILEADQTIQASEKLLVSAEESARVVEGQYKNGTAFIIELIDAQTARTTARTRLAQAKFDWYAAIARFERVVGRTLAEKGMTTSRRNSKR